MPFFLVFCVLSFCCDFSSPPPLYLLPFLLRYLEKKQVLRMLLCHYTVYRMRRLSNPCGKSVCTPTNRAIEDLDFWKTMRVGLQVISEILLAWMQNRSRRKWEENRVKVVRMAPRWGSQSRESFNLDATIYLCCWLCDIRLCFSAYPVWMIFESALTIFNVTIVWR